MKKLIDIPEEIIKDLKKMAIDENKDLKKLYSRPFSFTCAWAEKKNKKLPQISNRSSQVAMEHNVLPYCLSWRFRTQNFINLNINLNEQICHQRSNRQLWQYVVKHWLSYSCRL